MKKILMTLSLGMAGIALAAQNNTNLNPTVQVLNSYEGRVGDAERQAARLSVPDSLRSFDLNFDYSGFDTPYKGNDEFDPYFTDLEMAARPFDGKRLFLRAGAGYIAAPFIDAAYTFKDQGRFKAGAHAYGDSYFGRFRQILPDGNVLTPSQADFWKGYDAKVKAGLDARSDWENVSLRTNVDYEGAFGSGTPAGLLYTGAYNGVDANVGVESVFSPETGWRFTADAGYAFGYDKTGMGGGTGSSFEHNARLRLFGSYDFGGGHGMDMEVKTDVTLNVPRQSLDDYLGYTVTINPSYSYGGRSVFVSAGLGVLVDGGRNIMPRRSGELPVAVWPTLEFHWRALPSKIDVYANADLGGSLYGARASALDNRFFIPYSDGPGDSMCNVRRYCVKAGMRGNLWDKVDYDLNAGYENIRNNPLFHVGRGELYHYTQLSLIHENTGKVFAGLDLSGRFGGFSFDGKVDYGYYFRQNALRAVPPALSAALDFRYSIMNRASVSVGAEYRSVYRAGDYMTPYILDLHALADYRATNSLTVFLRGDNLMNRSLQFIPLYARKGICVSAGVQLNL